MIVYFVRHGESEGNALKVHQSFDTPLSEIGLSQAHMASHRFFEIPLDIILSSDLRRTQQTAEAINRKIHKLIELTPLLRELRRPSEIEGKLYTSPLSIQVREAIRAHRDEAEWHYSDEENYFDMAMRARSCLRMLEDRQESRILAVTHGLFLCMLVSTVIMGDSLTPELFESMYHGLHSKNTGITIFEYNDSEWRLLTWNDHAHLGAL